MKIGRDCVGVGVGAIVFNQNGEVFLAKRGPKAGNERGTWEFPGGKVGFGETLTETLVREFQEEYGMTIQIVDLLGVSDHILIEEKEHWVSPTYIAQHIDGTPEIKEPEKCTEIGWFTFETLPAPLSQITQEDVVMYQAKIKQARD